MVIRQFRATYIGVSGWYFTVPRYFLGSGSGPSIFRPGPGGSTWGGYLW